VWAWLLGLPEVIIGSARASRTGLTQGKRQNASAEETRRSPTAKIEKIIIKPDRKRQKKKAVRGMSLWMLASRVPPEGLYTTRRLCRGLFILPTVRNSYQISDYQTRSEHTSLVHAPSNNLRISRREGKEYESILINRVSNVYCRLFACPSNNLAWTLHGHTAGPNRGQASYLKAISPSHEKISYPPRSYEDTTCRMFH
jgi:hypothetical protein